MYSDYYLGELNIKQEFFKDFNNIIYYINESVYTINELQNNFIKGFLQQLLEISPELFTDEKYYETDIDDFMDNIKLLMNYHGEMLVLEEEKPTENTFEYLEVFVFMSKNILTVLDKYSAK